MLKINCLGLLEGLSRIIPNKRNMTCFYEIIHYSMQFSAVLNIFIVKTLLNSIFTNDLKRKYFFSKNVHSYRPSLFNMVTKHTVKILTVSVS